MRHGVYTETTPTAVRAVVAAPSALAFVVGTAPVHTRAGAANVGNLVEITSWQDVLDNFGYVKDFGRYTLLDFLYMQLKVFNFAPILCVNVFDPTAITTDSVIDDLALVAGSAKYGTNGIYVEAVCSDDAGLVPYDEGDDYTLAYDDQGYATITRVATGDIPLATSTVYVKYKAVAADRCGVAASAVVTGLEQIEQSFARTGTVPAIIACPGYSDDAEVMAAMVGKSAYGGGWQAYALTEIDCSAAGTDAASEVAAIKAGSGYTDKDQDNWWGRPKIGDDVFDPTSLVAAVLADTDQAYGGIPYVSGSNRTVPISGLVTRAGAAIYITDAQANDLLNAHGVNTFINHGGWRTWGNYSGAGGVSSDPAEFWRNYRRMLIWLNNTLRLDTSQIDGPANYRAIESIVNTRNIQLNGLAAQGAFVGKATIEFRREDNPLTQMAAGEYVFAINMCPPTPLQAVTFKMAIDVSQLAALFAGTEA